MNATASVRFALLLAASLVCAGTLQAQTLARAEINRISQAVVRIVAYQGGQEYASGSGTIVEPSGRIYTNRHVVEDADDFEIQLLEDANEPPVGKYRARLAGYRLDVDFAVLEVDRDAEGRSINASNLNLPYLSLAETEVQRGDHIYVFGYPGIGDGFLALTEGTITTIRNGTMNDARLPVWFQTDAQISPGNSGGLAVNSSSAIVGIPTAVQTENDTGGRLGGLLAIDAIHAALDSGLEQGTSVVSGGTTLPTVVNGRLDFNQDPYFGSVALAAGFTPDPHSIALTSGGEVAVEYLGSGCAGYAAIPPDYRVTWSGTSSLLRFLFVADQGGDTTLLVNRPDGSWVCNDDAESSSLDPMVALQSPAAGQYDIWVGSYGAGQFVEGTLYVTELSTLSPTSADRGGLDYSLDPYFGTATLAAGFTPDPSTFDIVAGGSIDASYIGGGCVGFAATAPDVRLNWSGNSRELRVFFAADGNGDATILISKPDASWACNDDANGGRNPMVVFDNPPAGQYDIWVGTYSRTESVEGTLTITELSLAP